MDLLSFLGHLEHYHDVVTNVHVLTPYISLETPEIGTIPPYLYTVLIRVQNIEC